MKKLHLLLLVTILICSSQSFAQVYSNMDVSKKRMEEVDSIKKSTYPYSLPIWGQKATSKGFKLPYSAGLGINYLWQRSELVINNLSIGINNGPMVNLDEIVRFNNATSEASALNIRPDIWILPFLNVYGILAKSSPHTSVDFGIWVPDGNNNWKNIANFATKADFKGQSLGFGMTPTIGVGGGWMALDMNCTWTDVDALDKPVFTFVFGPRLGKTFQLKKKDQNIAFWAGGFRIKYSSETSGSIALSSLLPEGGAAGGAKIDAAQDKVIQSQTQVNNWWNGLTPAEQKNPVNAAKYETANRVLTTAGTFLDKVEGGLSTLGNSTIQYSLDKKLKDMWNFTLGTQYQLNRHWMVRAEYGFLGTRNQLIAGLQYRFGL